MRSNGVPQDKTAAGWPRYAALMLGLLLLPLVAMAESPAVGYRLLVPGDSAPSWIYRTVIPYGWWDQLGAYDKFLECEGIKQAIRSEAAQRAAAQSRSAKAMSPAEWMESQRSQKSQNGPSQEVVKWVRDKDGKYRPAPGEMTPPAGYERVNPQTDTPKISGESKKNRKGSGSDVPPAAAANVGPLTRFDHRRLAAAECVPVR